MASSAINGFATTVTGIPDDSRFGFDYWNGSSFNTVQITKQNLQSALSQHFLNSNLQSTGNRSHDFDENDMFWGKVKTFRAEASIAPSATYGSYNLRSYGINSTDIGTVIASQAGKNIETYGDQNTRLYGLVGVHNSAPTPGYSLIASGGTIAAIRGDGAVYGAVFSGGVAAVYIVSPTAFGAQIMTTSGVAIEARVDGNGVAIHSDGKAYVEEYGLGAGMASTAVWQVNSTVRGALPAPRMTEAQRLAIVTPADGLMVFQTDNARGYYWYNDDISSWVLI